MADGVFYSSDDAELADILAENRVELPSETVAIAWGRPGRARECGGAATRLESETIGGVEVVFAVPEGVRSDSRILVLCGGRGWSGERSVRELGFAEWALERNWCVIAPSFEKGEYWNPRSGSAEVIRTAVASLCAKCGIRPLPVFLFGYSAGGQLVALLQAHDSSLAAAWAVYGCGVYPETSAVAAPAFVACGTEDSDRLRISRDFVYRARESGGLILWKPVKCGHEFNAQPLAMARAFFAAVSRGTPCALWGEDDTRKVCAADQIDPEFRNPLFTQELLTWWRR